MRYGLIAFFVLMAACSTSPSDTGAGVAGTNGSTAPTGDDPNKAPTPPVDPNKQGSNGPTGNDPNRAPALIANSIATKARVKLEIPQRAGGFSDATGIDIFFDPEIKMYFASYKIGLAAVTNCQDATGYSQFEKFTEASKHLDFSALADGLLRACVVTLTELPPQDLPLPVEGAREFTWSKDTTAPAWPAGSTLTITLDGEGTAIIGFPSATDGGDQTVHTPDESLIYAVFYGDSAQTDPVALSVSGTVLGAAASVEPRRATELAAGARYAFTVAVTDLAGNAARLPIVVFAMPGPNAGGGNVAGGNTGNGNAATGNGADTTPGGSGADTLAGNTGNGNATTGDATTGDATTGGTGDDDPPAPGSFQLSATSGLTATEGGSNATFTVTLDKAPTASVTVAVASSVPAQATVSPATLTFTTSNWNTPHGVTVTAVADQVDDGNQGFTITLAAASSADAAFNLVDPSDPTGQAIDVDTRGITTTPSSGLLTSEGGQQATFTVALASKPTASVTLGVLTADATEGTASPSSLSFTTSNWNTPQTVTVTGQSDAISDGDIAYNIDVSVTASADTGYASVSAVHASATNRSLGTFVLSAVSGIDATEGGLTGSFTVTLSRAPTADVTVGVSSSNTSIATVSTSSLTFTSGNFNVPQTVTVTATNDLVDDGDLAYSTILAAAVSADPLFSGVDPANPSGTAIDNDVAAIALASATQVVVTEASGAGHTATRGVHLATQPTGNVVIGVASGDATEATASPATLTFTTSNWNVNQDVTITAADDLLSDGARTYNIDLTIDQTATADSVYDNVTAGAISAKTTDDEPAAAKQIVLNKSTVTTAEPHGTDTFTVVLSAQPSDTVYLSISADAGAVPEPYNLTFTDSNWDQAQTVTLTAENDLIDNVPDVTYTVTVQVDSSDDTEYAALAPVTISGTNVDNEGGSTVGGIAPFDFTGKIATGRIDFGKTPLITWSAATGADSYTIEIKDALDTTVVEQMTGFGEPEYGVNTGLFVSNSTYIVRVTATNASGTATATSNPLSFVYDAEYINDFNMHPVKVRGKEVILSVQRPSAADFAGVVFYRQDGNDNLSPNDSNITYVAGNTYGSIKVLCVGLDIICIDDRSSVTDALAGSYGAYAFDTLGHYTEAQQNYGAARAPNQHIGGTVGDVACGTFGGKDLCFAGASELGVYTFDLTDTEHPFVQDLSPLPAVGAGGLAIADNLLFTTNWFGISVLDLTNAGSARLLPSGYATANVNGNISESIDVAAHPTAHRVFTIGAGGLVVGYDTNLKKTHPSELGTAVITKGDRIEMLGDNLVTSTRYRSHEVVGGTGPAQYVHHLKILNGDPTVPADFLDVISDNVINGTDSYTSDFIADPNGTKVMSFMSEGYGVVPVEVTGGGTTLTQRYLSSDPNERFTYGWGMDPLMIAGGVLYDFGSDQMWINNVFSTSASHDDRTGIRVMRFDSFGATPHLVNETSKDLVYPRTHSIGSGSHLGIGHVGYKVLASEGNRGFSVVDATDIDTSGVATLSMKSQFKWGEHGNGLAIDDTSRLMFVSEENVGVHAIKYDLVPTGGFQKLLNTNVLAGRQANGSASAPFEVALTADKATLFVAMGDDSIMMLDVQDPENMVELGYFRGNRGAIESMTARAGGERSVVISAATWQAADWTGPTVFEFFDTNNLKVGTGNLTVVSVNAGSRTVTFSGSDSDLDALAVGNRAYAAGTFLRSLTRLTAFTYSGGQYLAAIDDNYPMDSIAVFSFDGVSTLDLIGVKRDVADDRSKLVVVNGTTMVFGVSDDIIDHTPYNYNDDVRDFIHGYDISILTDNPGAASDVFTPFDISADTNNGSWGFMEMLADGADLYALTGREGGNHTVSRLHLSGSTLTPVANALVQGNGGSDNYGGMVRIGNRLSFFHFSDCGDGCATCSLTYMDVANDGVQAGKSHYIPCATRAMYAGKCTGEGGIGICSAAATGGVSFWRDD